MRKFSTVLMTAFILFGITGWFLRLFSDHRVSEPGSAQEKRLGSQVEIPAGHHFVGGEIEEDNRPRRRVYFRGFFMDIHPVVNRQYIRFLKESGYQPTGNFDPEGVRKRPLHPATGITLEDARAYARFYHKRLPTEWEWEIAARSLKKDVVYSAATVPSLETGNFFRYKQENGTTPVFSYPPNELGLYDMAGNVFEWTSSSYPSERVQGKYGKLYHLVVLRGGAWTNIAHDVRVTTRTPFPASRHLPWIGFRCVSDKQVGQ